MAATAHESSLCIFLRNKPVYMQIICLSCTYLQQKKSKSVQTFLFEIQKMLGNLSLNIKQRLGQGHLQFASNLRRIWEIFDNLLGINDRRGNFLRRSN